MAVGGGTYRQMVVVSLLGYNVTSMQRYMHSLLYCIWLGIAQLGKAEWPPY